MYIVNNAIDRSENGNDKYDDTWKINIRNASKFDLSVDW